MLTLDMIKKAAIADCSKTAMDEARASEILADAPDVAMGAHLRGTPRVLGKSLLGAGIGATAGLAARALLGTSGVDKAMKGDLNAVLRPYGAAAIAGALPGAFIGALKGGRDRAKMVKETLNKEFPDSDTNAIGKAVSKQYDGPALWRNIASLAGMGLGGALGARWGAKELPYKNMTYKPEWMGKILGRGAVALPTAMGAIAGYGAGSILGETSNYALNRKKMKEKAIQHLISKSDPGKAVASGGERLYPGRASDLGRRALSTAKSTAGSVYDANRSAFEKIKELLGRDENNTQRIESPE